MSEEIWKVCSENINYEVSNHGRVRSLDKKVKSKNNSISIKRGKILSFNKLHNGYYKVTFSDQGILSGHTVHRLVAKAFVDNPRNLPCVNHKDGDKTNNNSDNLEWVDYSENTVHSYSLELSKRGQKTL